MKRIAACLFLLLFCLCGLSACAPGRRERGVFDDSKKNVGIFLDEPQAVLALEAQPDVYAWFERWYEPAADNKLLFCGDHHEYTPFITWMPVDIPLAEIAEGRHDRYIRRFLRKIARTCPDSDVLIRFAHEMEIRPDYGVGWYSWQYWGGEEDFKAAWIHIVAMGRKLCPQARWVWSPNRADDYSLPYYPGDEYVDYVGISLNHHSDRRRTYRSFEDFYVLEGRRDRLEEYGKKIILSEVSYSCSDEAVKAAYLKSIFDYYQTDPCVAAICFFDEDKSDFRMFRFSDSEELLRVFTEGIRELHDEKDREKDAE